MLALLPLLAASFAPSALTRLSAVRQTAPAAKMLAGYATPFVYDGISQTADTTRWYSAGSRYASANGMGYGGFGNYGYPMSYGNYGMGGYGRYGGMGYGGYGMGRYGGYGMGYGGYGMGRYGGYGMGYGGYGMSRYGGYGGYGMGRYGGMGYGVCPADSFFFSLPLSPAFFSRASFLTSLLLALSRMDCPADFARASRRVDARHGQPDRPLLRMG